MSIRSFLTAPFLIGLLMMAANPAFLVAQTNVDTPQDLLPTEPVFSLKTSSEDSPAMARKKAALRLMKSYQVTFGQLKACQDGQANAGKAIGAFGQRNGNTLALVMKEIKSLGGITPEIRSVLDQEVAEAIAGPALSCPDLIKEVLGGKRDIYKGPEHQDDYKLINPK